MKTLIKAVFHKAGFEIRKLPDFKPGESGKNNLIVEFIGAPCVGKSTHLTKFEKYTSIHFNNGIGFGFFNTVDENTKDYHVEIMHAKVNILLEKGFSKRNIYKNINYCTSQINNDTKYLSVNGCVITEEGIFHSFTKQFIALADENVKLFKSAIKNRIFIHIKATPEKIYEQIIERHKKTKRLMPEHDTSKEEIIRMSSESIASKAKLIELIKLHNGSCLELDVKNGLEKNVKLIDEFIKKYL